MNMLQLVERLFPEKVQEAARRLKRVHARWKEIPSPLPRPAVHGRKH